MTGISIFFENKHQRPMGRGTWFRFNREERNADTSGRPIRLHAERQCEAFKMNLFDCYFRALLRLTRQMLNARVQHLPECLKKLDA